jgi:type II secretory pathway component GspD/PulD (secretin)
MEIALLSDEQNGTQIIQGAGTNGGPLTVPRISTREIITTATVPNNKTIVLGGLIVGKKSKEKSGIPLLSDIPYVGALFGSNSNKKDRSELMVFIQPSIISGDDSLKATQNDMNHRYDVSGGAQDFAVGDSGLFGMPDTLPIPVKESAAAAAEKKPVTKSKLGGIHHR